MPSGTGPPCARAAIACDSDDTAGRYLARKSSTHDLPANAGVTNVIRKIKIKSFLVFIIHNLFRLKLHGASKRHSQIVKEGISHGSYKQRQNERERLSANDYNRDRSF